LIKTDINGVIIWNKTLGLETTYIAFLSLDADTTGNIFLSGGTGYYDSFSDPLVMKLNACGEKEWCLDFSTPQHFDYAHSIVATDDGGCAVILRYTGVSPPQTGRICLAKIDADGNLLWEKCYNSSDSNLINEDSRNLMITPDKGFLITASCGYKDFDSISLYWTKPYLIKTDSLGNFQWERVIHANDSNNTGGDAWYSTINPTGQYYYTSISHYYHNPNIEKPAMVKLDLNGNVLGIFDIIHDFNHGGMSYAQFINDSTLAADCGWGNTQDDIRDYAVLIDTLGNILDTTFIVQDIYGSILRLCHDNKLAYMYNTYQNNQFDVYLRKLNYNLENDTLYTQPFTYDTLCPYQIVSDTIVQNDCGLIVGVEEDDKTVRLYDDKKGGLEIWPNPARDIVDCRLSMVDFRRDLTLDIYDIFGHIAPVRLISLPRLGEGWGGGQTGSAGWQVDVSALPPGIYLAVVREGTSIVASGKFVVVR
jgi:hypothetical protein